MVLFFEHEHFNHYFIESRYIFGVKGDFVVLRAFPSRYTICWFHIFKFFMKFLKFWNCSLLSFHICNPCYQCVLQHVQLLVVEFVTYCQKYSLIKRDKNHWSIYKSIINSPIGFDIVSTMSTLHQDIVDATLYRRWARLFRRCFNVVQRCFYVFSTPWSDFVSTLCNLKNLTSDFVFIFNVRSTLFHRSSTTLKQHWPTLKCWVDWSFASKSSWERQLSVFNKFIKKAPNYFSLSAAVFHFSSMN